MKRKNVLQICAECVTNLINLLVAVWYIIYSEFQENSVIDGVLFFAIKRGEEVECS